MVQPGDQFGRWTVQSTHLKRRGGTNRKMSVCLCSCGKTRHIPTYSLLSGRSKSCGCQRRNHVTHGATSGGASTEYRSWQRMKQRCYDPNTTGYEAWGGRGITVCPLWRDSFESFLSDMGAKPKGRFSIERVDNDGNYEPDNCYWATARQQARNTRRNRLISFNNRTMNVVEWAEETGLCSQTIRGRLDRSGWSIHKTLTTPSRGKYWASPL